MSVTTASATQFATSADGTKIAYETIGSGPAIVLVDGAMCDRSMGHARALSAELADHFTVYAYDRRGRGESGPGTNPYHADREIEDLDAMIEAAGGSAHVFAASSGAHLSLLAAARGTKINKLVAYEAPYVVDDSRTPNAADLPQQVQRMLAEGRNGDAVKAFLRAVGLPGPMIALMRFMPAWKQMCALATTVPNDLSMVVPFQQGRPIPADLRTGVEQDTLVIAGGKSPQWLTSAQAAVVAELPHGQLITLPGQTHMIKASVTAPVVVEHCLG